MFCFRDCDARVGVAFTDRHGGVSATPFDTLNLGTASADDPRSVARNYELLAAAICVGPGQLARMRQVHGADVAVLREAPDPDAAPEADAMVTARPGLALTVRVADCVPVLLADAAAGVVGCAHAGRVGLAAGVVRRAVAAMRDLGAARIRAWVGPSVCGRCYEVPEDLREEVAGVVPQARSTTSWGTPALDIAAGVRAQLEAAGCVLADVPALCTRESLDLYSHRRDGDRAGRAAGLVWLRP